MEYMERMKDMRKTDRKLAVALGLMLGAVCWTGGTASAADVAVVTDSAAGANVTLEDATAADRAARNDAVSLDFDASNYTEEHMACGDEEVAYRAYRGIVYVAHPAAAEAEQMNIFIPAAYFTGGTVNGYTAKTTPIFLPNGVGGYMPGEAGEPAIGGRGTEGPNAVLTALSRGYVVAAPAVRGRTTQDASGTYVGKAPAFLVDYKAAVRYLRYNKDRLPAGDTEKIISDGTSAGGALSALLGATGNSAAYAPYLSAIGAADERDDIFASMDYCPITNLEHADMAYEWMFSGVNEYHQSGLAMKQKLGAAPQGQPPIGKSFDGKPPFGAKPDEQPPMMPDAQAATDAVTDRPANAPQETSSTSVMTGRQIAASLALKSLFPAYVNSLGLKDADGEALTLDANGMGSFADFIDHVYMASAQSALDGGDTTVADLDWLTVQDGQVLAMDRAKYAAWATRLKATPAFDKFDLSSGENDEFADKANTPKHFTAFSAARSDKGGAMADAATIRLMNPMAFIGSNTATVAPHWRIRHGAKDRDTSLAIPALLALALQNAGYDVDFAAPWGKGHAGDYDLDELFDWADSICK